MKVPKEYLSYLQDETDAPYREGERPIPLTAEKDIKNREYLHSLGLTFEDEAKLLKNWVLISNNFSFFSLYLYKFI